MSQTITPQINPRFRAPPCPTAPFGDPGCIVVTYPALSISQPFILNVGTTGQVNTGLSRVHAVKVDNLYGSKEIVITASDSRDIVSVPAGSVGMFSLTSATCVFTVIDAPLLSSTPLSYAATRTLVFYDTPQVYYCSQGVPTGSQTIQGRVNLNGVAPGTTFYPVIPALVLPTRQLRRISSLSVWLDAATQVGISDTVISVQCFWQLPPAGPVLGTFFQRAYYITANILTANSYQLCDFNFEPDFLIGTDYQIVMRVDNSSAVIQSAYVSYTAVMTTSELEP